MSDFTPGPWRAVDTTYPDVWDIVTEADSALVTVDACEADARLIAAAPDMYAALVAISEGVSLKDSAGCHEPTCLMCFEIARRALDKADGAGQ